MAEVAVLVAEGFEDSEFRVPVERLRSAGHHVVVVGAVAGESVRGKRGYVVEVAVAASDLDPAALDAVLVPGGHAPDRLRLEPDAVDLVREVGRDGRLVAAICHGPWLLAAAGLVVGRTVTSWPSIRPDLEHAGATWVDRNVVEDANLVTSRRPGDLDEFTATILRKLAEPANGVGIATVVPDGRGEGEPDQEE